VVREEIQRGMIARLGAIPAPKALLPALAVERVHRAQMETLARGLAEGGV
jgi:hypothetical protein